MAPKKRPPRAAPPSAKRAKATTPVVTMPPGFKDEWRLIKELRKDRTAVVDTMGCERLADPQASEKDRRYHVLVSLMLSSQTKDTVNAAVMGALKARGLSVKRILDETSEDEFHELIKPVGFHNVKTKNIRKATQILRDQYDEEVPSTMEALLALPGVGPKMALLVLKCAFDITAGISVDTHVHRISNQLGWTGGTLCGNQNVTAPARRFLHRRRSNVGQGCVPLQRPREDAESSGAVGAARRLGRRELAARGAGPGGPDGEAEVATEGAGLVGSGVRGRVFGAHRDGHGEGREGRGAGARNMTSIS